MACQCEHTYCDLETQIYKRTMNDTQQHVQLWWREVAAMAVIRSNSSNSKVVNILKE